MYKRLSIIFLLVVLVGTAVAQAPVVAQANIPFAFRAHNQSFSAGNYQIRRIGATVVRLVDSGSQQGVTLLAAQNIASREDVTLTFREFSGHAVLVRVKAPSFGVEVAVPHEIEMGAVRGRTREVVLTASE